MIRVCCNDLEYKSHHSLKIKRPTSGFRQRGDREGAGARPGEDEDREGLPRLPPAHHCQGYQAEEGCYTYMTIFCLGAMTQRK